jgi:hypothetical protein
MARVAFPITVFYDPSGAPLANGYVKVSLTQDAMSPTGQVCGSCSLNVVLDSTGTMVSVPQVYPCSQLNPATVQYVITAYTSSGEIASGPDFVTV